MFKRVYGFFHEESSKHSEVFYTSPVPFKRMPVPDEHERVLVTMTLAEYMILQGLFDELGHADKKYITDPMEEPLVGIKTIECELKELERELARSVPRPKDIYKEANQTMTMAYKFIRDICKGTL